jgi:hypothetical protein
MNLGLRLPSLFTRCSNSSQFANIEGYEDVKNVIVRAVDADENYNLLLCGPPASSKTLFLMGILDITKPNELKDEHGNTISRERYVGLTSEQLAEKTKKVYGGLKPGSVDLLNKYLYPLINQGIVESPK